MAYSPQSNKWQGKMLGRYHVLQQLGKGGMGEVWLAEDTQLLRKVAIKLLPAVLATDKNYLDDFKHEARAAAALDHPNILPVHDFGEQIIDDLVTTYLVMPYISGGTLRDRIKDRRGLLPTEEALHYLKQAAEAIDYAHSQKIIHRDIKTANLLLQQDWLFLADLGIAKLLNSVTQRARTHTGAGTPDYMAPEQVQGKAEFASDRYSLTVIAYLLFTGRLPFTGETPYAIMMKQVTEQPPDPRELKPSIPAGVASALLQGLAKNPAQRPPSCKALVETLALSWQNPGLFQDFDPEATLIAPRGQGASRQALNNAAAPVTPYQPDNQEAIARDVQSPNPDATKVSNPSLTPIKEADSEQRFSRRQMLIGGGIGVAAVLGAGGLGIYALEHSNAHTGSEGSNTHTPQIAEAGPHKLVAGTPLVSLTGHSASIEGIAWHPSGRYLATIAEDTHMMVWDLASALKNTASGIQTISTPMTDIKVSNDPGADITQGSISWAQDGKTLAVVAGGSTISLYNAFNQGASAQVYQDVSKTNSFDQPIYYEMSWIPDTNLFAVIQNDLPNTKLHLQIWQQGRMNGPIKSLYYDKGMGTDSRADLDSIACSPDGKYIAAMTNFQHVLVWDRIKGQIFQDLTLPPKQVSGIIETQIVRWSPANPDYLLAADLDSITVWDIQKNQQLLTLQLDEPGLKGYNIRPWGAAWSPNGEYVATCFPHDPLNYIWDVRTDSASMQKLGTTRKQILRFPKKHSLHNKAVNNLAWSPDGKYIADCSADTTAIIYKVDAS